MIITEAENVDVIPVMWFPILFAEESEMIAGSVTGIIYVPEKGIATKNEETNVNVTVNVQIPGLNQD